MIVFRFTLLIKEIKDRVSSGNTSLNVLIHTRKALNGTHQQQDCSHVGDKRPWSHERSYRIA